MSRSPTRPTTCRGTCRGRSDHPDIPIAVFGRGRRIMKLPRCTISAMSFAALVTGILCEPVAAAVIFASGTPPTVHDTTGGTIISDISGMRQYIGVRFQIVAQPVLANEIGGNLIRGRDFGNNQIFAALIALSGATDFPDSARPLNTPDVLRVALITPPSPFNDDVSAPI